jgi:hypothetical protein
MTNNEALEEILSTLATFRNSLRAGVPGELEELLRDKSIEWTLHEELRGVATILIRAWLEAEPTSQSARALAEEHLAGVGRHDEAKRVAAGSPVDTLELKRDKIKAFFEEVAASQRD